MTLQLSLTHSAELAPNVRRCGCGVGKCWGGEDGKKDLRGFEDEGGWNGLNEKGGLQGLRGPRGGKGE